MEGDDVIFVNHFASASLQSSFHFPLCQCAHLREAFYLLITGKPSSFLNRARRYILSATTFA